MHAAEFAIKFASELNAELYAVTVVDTETLYRLTKMRLFVEEEKEEFEMDLERTASKNLNYIKEQGKSHKLDIKTFLLKGCIHKIV